MVIPQTTSARETHLSRLFFTPTRVFKQLKPVQFPFVDFSDTDVRCAAATHEYERNKQITPDVYLGLADVCEEDQLVDRMIVMRRLRDQDALPELLNRGNDDELVRTAARHVAQLHAGLTPLRGADAEPASAVSITKNWCDNFETVARHVGDVIDPNDFAEVKGLVEHYVAGRSGLFDARIADGWVRDGHGDLRAEHIYCTADGPRMIDCVAFDDRLRIADALCDVAFLAMDLDRLVGPPAAVELMRAWNEYTNESHPSSLAHFYVAYRAHVRCKIACLRHSQGIAGSIHAAKRYHDQALRHLRLARIRLILVGGGPGSGKSTVAEAVAAATGAVWLRSDEIRKDLAGISHDDHAFADPGTGAYSEAMNAKVQQEMMRQARLLIASGVSVVLDATWRVANQREELRRLADETTATMSELLCVLPAPIAKERIARRMASIYNPSDASPELVDYIADRFDAWATANEIDTSGTVKESVTAAIDAISPPSTSPDTATETGHRFILDLSTLRDFVLIAGGIDGP